MEKQSITRSINLAEETISRLQQQAGDTHIKEIQFFAVQRLCFLSGTPMLRYIFTDHFRLKWHTLPLLGIELVRQFCRYDQLFSDIRCRFVYFLQAVRIIVSHEPVQHGDLFSGSFRNLMIIFLLNQSKCLFLVCNRKVSAFLIFRRTPEVKLYPASMLININRSFRSSTESIFCALFYSFKSFLFILKVFHHLFLLQCRFLLLSCLCRRDD